MTQDKKDELKQQFLLDAVEPDPVEQLRATTLAEHTAANDHTHVMAKALKRQFKNQKRH